jgi:hypothetical protein
MMTWAACGAPRNVALPHCKMVSGTIASRWVTSPVVVPVSGKPCGDALVSINVVACSHVLQAMMTPPVHMSCRHLDNARACLENTRAYMRA